MVAKKIAKKRVAKKAVRKPVAKQRSTVTDEQRYPPHLFEVGRSGLRRYGGYLSEEWQQDLRGTKAATVYREMSDNEPVIAATLLVFEMLLRQTEIWVQASDEAPEAQEAKELVETALDDVEGGWNKILSDALTMLVYGYSLLEIVYKLRRGPDQPEPLRSKHNDGRFGWRRFGLRSANSIEEWDYRDEASDVLLGAWQRSPSDYRRRYLPMGRMLHFRLRPMKDSPEGYSLLRPVYTSYFFLKNFRFVEAVGIERNLAGMPCMEVPPNIFFSSGSDETTAKTSVKNFLREIRQDEQLGAMVPSETDRTGKPTGWKFKLLPGGGQDPKAVDPIIRRLESRMAMAMLTEVMLLGQDAMGSYALSRDKTELLVVGLAGIMDTILQQFNEKAIPELLRLNGLSQSVSPTLEHGHIKAPNLADIGAYIASLSGAGLLTPDEQTETTARKLAGLPEPSGPTAGLAPARTMALPTQGAFGF